MAQQPRLNSGGKMRFLLQWVWIRKIEETGKPRVYEVLFTSRVAAWSSGTKVNGGGGGK